MLSYFLRIILRSFLRRPLYPVLNIICLSIGFLSIISISIWLKDELSYDSFHENSENIYRLTVEVNDPATGYYTHFARSWLQWLGNIDEQVPEINNMVRFSYWDGGIVSRDDNSFKTNLFYTDPSFFQVFDVEFESRSDQDPLSDPYTLIITNSAAKKYFGNDKALGEVLEVYCTRCREKKEYTVTAVIKEFPNNSHFHFDILAAYEDPDNIGWGYYYLLLNETANPEDILEKFSSFALTYVDNDRLETFTPHLQKLRDIHLESNKDRELQENGNKKNIWLFSFLGLAVLFLSFFNYLNLQYNWLIYRFSSLSVMKVFGATRRNLSFMQLIEIIILNLLAIFLSFVMFFLLSGELQSLLGKDFQTLLSTSGTIFIISLILGLFILSLLAGFYPWVLTLLKTSTGKWQQNSLWASESLIPIQKRGFSLARIMVILQYSATAAVLILMLFSNRQVAFFMNQSMGGIREKILVVRNLPVQVINKYEVFKEELLTNPLILEVTTSFEDPADENMDMMPFEAPGVSPEIEEKMLYVFPAGDNYFDFYNIDFIAGRNFSDFAGNDSIREGYILNETALNYLGWEAEDAIDRPFSLVFNYEGGNLFNGGEIIGVVEDFQPSSMKNTIKPYVFFQKSFWMFSSQIRFDSTQTEKVLEDVEAAWKEVYPGFPFEYTFIEDLYKNIYSNEFRLRNLGLILGILTLLISTLGLWAISGVIYKSRTREVAIRRVNGAHSYQIFWILIRDVVFMQGIAMIIGLSAAYFIVQNWLANFAYKIELTVWSFLFIALFIITLSIITAGYHALRISLRSPILSIRYE